VTYEMGFLCLHASKASKEEQVTHKRAGHMQKLPAAVCFLTLLYMCHVATIYLSSQARHIKKKKRSELGTCRSRSICVC
jgi:hypothetical protein